MKLGNIMMSASVATLLVASSAHALTYATTITPEGGTTVSTATATSNRTDPGNALGAPDDSFFSLGLGKFADFTFGTSFTGDGVVYEVTNGSVAAWPEFVDIFVYNSPLVTLTEVAKSVRNTTAQLGAVFSFSGTWDTLRLVDVTARECSAQSLSCTGSTGQGADGFDVDAVGVSVVPLPAAAWLLLGASGALIAAKRRQSRKAA